MDTSSSRPSLYPTFALRRPSYQSLVASSTRTRRRRNTTTILRMMTETRRSNQACERMAFLCAPRHRSTFRSTCMKFDSGVELERRSSRLRASTPGMPSVRSVPSVVHPAGFWTTEITEDTERGIVHSVSRESNRRWRRTAAPPLRSTLAAIRTRRSRSSLRFRRQSLSFTLD